jgi:hypothetical protein
LIEDDQIIRKIAHHYQEWAILDLLEAAAERADYTPGNGIFYQMEALVASVDGAPNGRHGSVFIEIVNDKNFEGRADVFKQGLAKSGEIFALVVDRDNDGKFFGRG